MSIEKEMRATGVEVNYYFICKRKLWLFTHGITMEHNSDRVKMGKEVHENSFARREKEILIDNLIALDFIDSNLVINETKLTISMDEASKYQLLYYIYYLEKKGLEGVKGEIRYPKSKRKETIEINDFDREYLNKIISEIADIKEDVNLPSIEKSNKCKKCSYFEFCFC